MYLPVGRSFYLCWLSRQRHYMSQPGVCWRSIATRFRKLALGQRIGRVELLLEKLLEKSSQGTEKESVLYGPVDVLTSSSTLATTYGSHSPYMSLFDDVLGQQAETNTSMRPPQSVLASASSPPTSAGQIFPIRIENLRRRLAAMLPCQEDVNYLSELSHG